MTCLNKLILQSIEHWKENLDNCILAQLSEITTEFLDFSPKSCALCEAFLKFSCKGCPIYKKTKQRSCEGTPYDVICNFQLSNTSMPFNSVPLSGIGIVKQLVEKELIFLYSLLQNDKV